MLGNPSQPVLIQQQGCQNAILVERNACSRLGTKGGNLGRLHFAVCAIFLFLRVINTNQQEFGNRRCIYIQPRKILPQTLTTDLVNIPNTILSRVMQRIKPKRRMLYTCMQYATMHPLTQITTQVSSCRTSHHYHHTNAFYKSKDKDIFTVMYKQVVD